MISIKKNKSAVTTTEEECVLVPEEKKTSKGVVVGGAVGLLGGPSMTLITDRKNIKPIDLILRSTVSCTYTTSAAMLTTVVTPSATYGWTALIAMYDECRVLGCEMAINIGNVGRIGLVAYDPNTVTLSSPGTLIDGLSYANAKILLSDYGKMVMSYKFKPIPRESVVTGVDFTGETVTSTGLKVRDWFSTADISKLDFGTLLLGRTAGHSAEAANTAGFISWRLSFRVRK